MGYCMHQTESSFFIAAADKQAALEAAKTMPPSTSNWGYRWVEEDQFRAAETLEALFDEWLYDASVDADGNIVDLQFVAEKIGDEEELFKVIAPWVRAGSYLQMAGEDGAVWRWSFDGSTCCYQEATLSFDS